MAEPLPLVILAFDHRGEFSRSVLGREVRELSPDERQGLSAAKSLIFDGYLLAASRGLPAVRSGVLVDEEYGAEAARRAEGRDILLAMPVEEADRDVFEFEYRDQFGEHIRSFDPDYVKALVRYNPEDDAGERATQLERLKKLSDWLVEAGYRFIFELIVRPSESQLASVGGDRVRYEDELRPALVVQSIEAVLGAGIHVDLWKLEGVSSTDDARSIVSAARRGGDEVECVILGAAADESRVDQWLRVSAETDGFAGFAIGRNIWRDSIRGWLSGEISRDHAVTTIAANYDDFIARYLGYVR